MKAIQKQRTRDTKVLRVVIGFSHHLHNPLENKHTQTMNAH